MTNEEKKTIERFKNFIYTYQDVIEDEYSDYEEKESAKEYQEVSEKILNLIKKQSKEIEELKEKDDANLAYYDQIYQNGIYTGQKAVEDKIKAKIEELENDKNRNKTIFVQAILYSIEVLQSLLEKE